MAENTAPALLRFGVPLGIFLALVVLLAIGLNLNPREVPSPLIDKPAPGFFLPQLHAPHAAGVLAVSSVAGRGLDELKELLWQQVQRARTAETVEPTSPIGPHGSHSL